jgi:hypothetical protein
MLVDSAPVRFLQPGRGRTAGHRTIAVLAALFAAGAWSAAPAAAAGGPLLSGYGGPGEGSQEILGSALIGGAGGSGAGTGGSGSAGAGGGESLAGAAIASTGSPAPSARRISGASGGHGHGTAAAGQPAKRLAETAGEPVPAASAAGSQTLALSGEDVAYMLVAIGALVLTGALTRRLAHLSR